MIHYLCFLFVLQILMEVARSKNSIPLPQVKPHCGIRLPPDAFCLTACNYKLKAQKKVMAKSVGASSTPGPRMTGVVRATIRPNSPAVRVTTTPASTTPRPLVKVNVGSAASASTAPKIQIVLPPQPTPVAAIPAVEKQEPGADCAELNAKGR